MVRTGKKKAAVARSVHTNKSDLGFALMGLGRSGKFGPRKFEEKVLRAWFVSIKDRRSAKLSKRWLALYEATREDLISSGILTRHADGKLSLSQAGRDRFRVMRKVVRQSDLCPEEKHLLMLKLMKKEVGPANAKNKAELLRYTNELEAKLAVSRPIPLQAWNSMSTVDGDAEDVEMEGLEQEDEVESSTPRAGPSSSPMRPKWQARLNPAGAYPSPVSAPRPARAERKVVAPPTPSPAGSSRVVSKMLVEPTDLDMDDYEAGPVVSGRISWGQEDDDEPSNGAMNQCKGHIREIQEKDEEIRNMRQEKQRYETDGKAALDEWKHRCESLQQDVGKLHEEKANLESKIATDSRVSKEELAKLQAQFDRDKEELREKYDAMCCERDELKNQLEKAKGDLAILSEESRLKYEQHQTTCADLEAALEALQKEQGGLTADVQARDERIAILEDEKNAKAKEVLTWRDRCGVLTGQCGRLKDDLQTFQKLLKPLHEHAVETERRFQAGGPSVS